jgi:hypothetical protein
MQTDLWVGVLQHRWNLEQPLVFQVVILSYIHGINWFHNIKPIIWGQLDAWEAAQYVALVKEVEEANLSVGGRGGGIRVQQEGATLIARNHHNMVLGGKVRAAIRMVTSRGASGSYRPHNLDFKSGRPVLQKASGLLCAIGLQLQHLS